MEIYRKGGVEPPFDEVLEEPIIRLVMRRDAVSERELVEIAVAAGRQLRYAMRRTWVSNPPEEGDVGVRPLDP